MMRVAKEGKRREISIRNNLPLSDMINLFSFTQYGSE